MAIVLGIDTGGTYTDGVIVDLDKKKILAAAKTPTTHENLLTGIENVIAALAPEQRKIDYAALSTTLATNAIVENKGCRVGALILGHEPEAPLPQCRMAVLPGAMDLMGRETEPLDREKTRAAIEGFRGQVDAVAVSGIFSVRNPDHEKEVKALVREMLGLPVVAAHELTTALGIKERTVTAILNARLISVIDRLLSAAKEGLKKMGFDVPLMIVKGDGSLMNETVARERPIGTILSGPAASIIGATFLNGVEQGVVVDIGGTTTDIAVLQNGRPHLAEEGAKVGGWRTRVVAADVTTIGLGGDSRIFFDTVKKEIRLGPQRVLPIAAICAQYPSYFEELRRLQHRHVPVITNEAVEGYLCLKAPPAGLQLTKTQEKALALLADGPHTVVAIADALGVDPNLLALESLVHQDILALIGFTPTDMLHADGEYMAGHAEGAKLAAALVARRWGLTTEDFLQKVRKIVTENLCRHLLNSIWEYEKAPQKESGPMAEYLFQRAIWEKEDSLLSHGFTLKVPLVGIGAPAGVWLPPAAEKFHTPLLLPDHYAVANAVGAAAGKVMTIYRILVQNHENEGISVYAPWGKKNYARGLAFFGAEATDSQEERMNKAAAVAVAVGRKKMVEEMARQGIADYEILVEREDRRTGGNDESLRIHIETRLAIIAVGRPQWR